MTSTNDKWQSIVAAIPSLLNFHFKGSTAELSNVGLIVSLPAPGAKIEAIQKQIEKRYIREKVTKFFGDIAINYQVSLLSISRTSEPEDNDLDDLGGIDEPTENWFKFPYMIFNDLHKMSPAEVKVLIYITRHTWGYHQTEREISVTEFEQGRRAKRNGEGKCVCDECKEKGLFRLDHGTGMTEKSIRNGLKKAVENGYLNVRIDDHDKGRMKKFYRLKIR